MPRSPLCVYSYVEKAASWLYACELLYIVSSALGVIRTPCSPICACRQRFCIVMQDYMIVLRLKLEGPIITEPIAAKLASAAYFVLCRALCRVLVQCSTMGSQQLLLCRKSHCSSTNIPAQGCNLPKLYACMFVSYQVAIKLNSKKE